jgi:murein DD-endopeptidase MepM/ murein hydrolase activator NlpD
MIRSKFAALACGLILLTIATGCDPAPEETKPSPIGLSDLGPTDRYGFDIREFVVTERQVRRAETVSDILSGAGVGHGVIARLAEQSSDTFDLRRIRAGRPYRLYMDSSGVARYFVYEPDRTEYVVVRLSDPTSVERISRPVTLKRRIAEGQIERSLYETLLEADLNPSLAFDLSEIFAWQIDFHHLQKGDHFRVIFDERFISSEPVGLGIVHAALFVHRGEEFSAFHFDKEGDIAYFDADGNSLRKEFLAAPVRYSRIASKYTRRRLHPVLKRYRSHLGTDYAAPTGTPIRATGDGVVVEAAYRGGNGRYVKIRHNSTYTTGYLHMSRIASGIRSGATVQQGDVIGFVGSSGLASGPHVCYRFWKNGAQVDPLREDFPPARPVSEGNLADFQRLRDGLLPELTDASELVSQSMIPVSREGP